MVYSAFRDENDVPVAIGVDSTNGSLVLPFKISPITGRLLTDSASGSGTVTSVSVVSANGFAGTVATATTTPAITLSTTVTGILSGNGTAISAASTTGSGAVVLANTPTLITPVIGVATGTSLTVSGVLYSQTSLVLEETGAGVDTVTIQVPSSIAASYTLTLPIDDGTSGQVLSTDGSGVLSWIDASAGANVALSNLAGVSINTSLLAQTGVDLGSTTKPFRNIFFFGGGTFATTYIELTGTPTSTRVWTFPDTTDTVVGKATTDTFTNKTFNTAGTGNVFQINGTGITAITGTGAAVLANTPTLITPVLGVATATSINGLTITSTTGVLTMTNAKTLAVTNSLTLSGTDSTVMTFPTTSKTIAANDGSNWTIASQAIGDILTATSTTAYGRLAAVAVGQVLISAGTGTAPAWSAGPSVTTLEIGAAGATDTTLSRSSAGVLAVEGVVVDTISATNTLTNKRITPRVLSAASYTTDTGSSLNGDTQDMFIVTAQTGALKFNNPSGTPTDGQKLIITVASSTTAARALTWDTAFGSTTVTLPSTTAATTVTLSIGFIWSASKSLWQCVAVA